MGQPNIGRFLAKSFRSDKDHCVKLASRSDTFSSPIQSCEREEVVDLAGQLGEGLSFTGATVQALSGPCIYVWLRNDVPLYVGMSRHGITRPCGPNHHALAIRSTDELLVYPVETVASARRLERLLIERLRPERNVHFRDRFVYERLGLVHPPPWAPKAGRVHAAPCPPPMGIPPPGACALAGSHVRTIPHEIEV